MKTTQLFLSLFVALALATFAGVGRAQTNSARNSTGTGATELSPPRAQDVATGQAATTPNAAAATAKWAEIKDLPYDTRDLFFVGLRQLYATVDAQVVELAARRAAMKSTADTKEWDFAMKEMNDSRSYLKSVGDELRKASVEAWNQKKETVGQAWVRTQEAYMAVKKSTTS